MKIFFKYLWKSEDKVKRYKLLKPSKDGGINMIDIESMFRARVGSEYFQSTRVRVLSTSEVLEYEYEYFSLFYKSSRVQSTQNVLMNTLMSTFRC